MSSTYSVIYSFGDSLSDAGDAYLLTSSAFAQALDESPQPVSPPYAAESYGSTTADVFSNGQIWVQDLAYSLGLTGPGPGQVGTTGDQLLAAGISSVDVALIEAVEGVSDNSAYFTIVNGAAGGTDFAVGGSVTGPNGFSPASDTLTDLSSQIANFQHEYPTPSPGALYTVWSGSNDVLNLLQSSQFTTQDAGTSEAEVAQSAQNEVNAVEQLAGLGAKTVLVADLPDLGLTPALASAGQGAVGTTYARYFNAQLSQDLTNAAPVLGADGTTVQVMDVFDLIDNAVSTVDSPKGVPGSLAVPGENGGTVTVVNAPAYTGSFTADNGPEVSDPDNYLFFDQMHPTQTGHQAVANLADSTLNPACFCTGTRIRTPGGDVPVELLREGELVLTASGGPRPVRWIGRRSYGGRFLRRDGAMQPVRFAAGSLGAGLPLQDLLVSPDHAMAVDGALVPARALVNGATITRERLPEVHYVHVELDTHALLFAEGAPSESFVDDEGSRNRFSNAAEFRHRFGDEPAVPARFCLPRLSDGPHVEAVRRRLPMLGRSAAA